MAGEVSGYFLFVTGAGEDWIAHRRVVHEDGYELDLSIRTDDLSLEPKALLAARL
jgi:hypothetical protein